MSQPTTAHNLKTVDGLMANFYDRAKQVGAVSEMTRSGNTIQQIRLTAKQFEWLANVDQRESGPVPQNRGRRVVTGQVVGVGFFDAVEQMHGSAIVTIRILAPAATIAQLLDQVEQETQSIRGLTSVTPITALQLTVIQSARSRLDQHLKALDAAIAAQAV
jgi:hypothetical protein